MVSRSMIYDPFGEGQEHLKCPPRSISYDPPCLDGELGKARCYPLRPTMVSEEGTGGKEGSDDE